MDRLLVAQDLADRGRFAEAYTALALAAPSDQDLPVQVLRAELLERIGRPDEARRAAERIVTVDSASATHKSACELVLGRICWEQGDSQSALEHLQRSVAYAQQAGNVGRLCWAQLRLLVAVAERSSADAIGPLLADVRANAIKFADPTFTAALHIGLAEIEAKRGLLDMAERHLDIGEEILARSETNYWLSAAAANTRLALAILRNDFTSGVDYGGRALAAAERSGSSSALASALINLGNIYFSIGAYDRAIEYLERAERSAPFPVLFRLGAIETIARIHIAQDRLDDAEAFLAEVTAFRHDEDQRALYIQRHTELTNIRILAARGRWIDAANRLQQLTNVAHGTGDQLLLVSTLLAKAELAIRRGDALHGTETLRETLPVINNGGPETFARFEGLLACALRATGSSESGTLHYRRARRILAAIRGEPVLVDLKRLWVSTRNELSGGELPRADAIDALGSLAAVLSMIGRPDLCARELFDVLVRAGAISSGSVLAHQKSRPPTSITKFGQIPTDVKSIVVGVLGDTSYELQISTNDDIQSDLAVNAIEQLVTSLGQLDAVRKEGQKRIQLWPADDRIGTGGVVNGYFKTLTEQATRVARTNATVLITGESGTGKEILARAIHGFSPRAARPFIAFNCSAIPRDLIEGQMFGHRRGAFTGADRDYGGIIRAAADGTLFLDEIGDFSLDLQPKLLRFFESSEIFPLGETRPVKVDVRVVAASNRDLEQLVADGAFREDLFYRLNVVRLRVPPLRERRDEIPGLAEHFARQAAQEYDKGDVRISADTMEYLLLFRWPGNVRQLANELRRIVVMAERNSTITPEDLSAFITTGTIKPAPAGVQPPQPTAVVVRMDQPLARATEDLERAMLAYALKQAGGRLEDAASLLGLSRKGLYLKRQRLGMN